ncbi:hypothetical protein BHE74_00028661 [Ensete ventricosum]|nr:hypothetical protein GW17_00031897 [Ensete ventricosum]RWW64114.1 hypothetical protein BHE74_00028661 [Ensete ventricosum]RZS05916.1 hypothetical protein BHM03_00036475 [Ensete ventricosum]
MSRTASDEGVVAPANVHIANGEHAHGTREGSCRRSDPPGLRRVPEEWRRLRRCLEAAAKGFAIGAGLKGGLALFSVLVRLKSRISLRSSARFGRTVELLFLFCFRTAGWRSLLAGLIAGPSMLLTGPNKQHTSLAMYILMRAGVLASRCGIKSRLFGGVCRPLTWSYGDIFLMCLASSQILYV